MPEFVVVTATYLTPEGEPCSGRVTFTLSATAVDAAGDVVFPAVSVTETLDSDGRFSTRLLATDDPTISPPGLSYRVSEVISGAPARVWSMLVPSGGPLDLADVSPVLPAAAVYAYAPAVHQHAASDVSFAPGGGLVSTDVQAAIVEAAGMGGGGGSGGASTAADVSFSPVAPLTATDVQSALVEAAGLAAGKASPSDVAVAVSGLASVGYVDSAVAAVPPAPVQSVAGRAGAVMLTKSDVGLGNVTNVAPADLPVSTAQQAAVDAVRARSTHSGTQAASTIADLVEAVQDIVAALIVAGTGTTVTYDDTAGTFTITSSATGGSTDPEIVRDVIGGALVAGAGVQVVVNDAADTITVSSTAVLPTRKVTAGTGLMGGGDLGADRTLAVQFGSAAGTAAEGNDPRLSDARTPTVHGHVVADVTGLQAALDGKVQSDDARLSDVRTPANGSVTAAKLATGLIVPPDKLGTGSPSTATYLRGDGAWTAPPSGGGSAPPDRQFFTASGSWTKPAGAVRVEVHVIGGGGGGGSGRRGAAGTTRCGGGGGGGGGWSTYTFTAANVPATVAVTVGQGGAGGIPRTTDDGHGFGGDEGGPTSFGSLLQALGGSGGNGGSASNGTGGVGGAGSNMGASGAPASSSGTIGASPAASGGGQGGCSGGGITASNSANRGGTAGASVISSYAGGSAGSGGVVNGAAPSDGGSAPAGIALPGWPGGGGAASITTTAQAGGNGGNWGAGGSGGGASLNGSDSGAGGNGGSGCVLVITHF